MKFSLSYVLPGVDINLFFIYFAEFASFFFIYLLDPSSCELTGPLNIINSSTRT